MSHEVFSYMDQLDVPALRHQYPLWCKKTVTIQVSF